MLHLSCYASGPAETNTYILSCPKTKQAAIIDAAPESCDWVLETVKKEGLKVKMILMTHSHWDHIADVAAIHKALGAAVYAHPDDAGNVEAPGSDGIPLRFPIEGCPVEHLLKDGEEILLGELKIRVIHTPGHTRGGVCFYLEKEKVLISGDTLFQGTIGRLNLPTSVPDQMWDSLKRLAELPKETKVYPGHGDPTTLEEESWIENAKQRFMGGSS